MDPLFEEIKAAFDKWYGPNPPTKASGVLVLPDPDVKPTIKFIPPPSSPVQGQARVGRPVQQNFYFPQQPDSPLRRYFLEFVEGSTEEVLDAVEIPNVNHVESDSPLAANLTWTYDGMYEEHSGFAERNYVLRGRSGQRRHQLIAYYKFLNFLEKYAKTMAENKGALTRRSDTKLVLNFPWEGESYYCTVTAVKQVSTTATSRFSYEYLITLRTHGLATRKWSLPETLRLLAVSGDDAGMGSESLREAWTALAEVPESMYPVYEGIGNLLSITARTEYLQSRGSVGFSGLPREQAKTLYVKAKSTKTRILTVWDQATEAYREAERLSGRLDAVLSWLSQVMAAVEQMYGAVCAHIGSEVDAQPSDGLETVPVLYPSTNEPLIVDYVREGDSSLFDVAQRVYGSRERWWILARINGFQDARTRGDGEPLAPDQTLFIPHPDGVTHGAVADIYGTDLRVGTDGDLVLSGTTDVAVVSGVDCVKQNLRHRYMTIKGENRSFREYGMPKLIGTIATSDIGGQVMSAVKRQTLRDHRVAGLSQLSAQRVGGTVSVDVAVELVANVTTPVSFQYPGL